MARPIGWADPCLMRTRVSWPMPLQSCFCNIDAHWSELKRINLTPFLQSISLAGPPWSPHFPARVCTPNRQIMNFTFPDLFFSPAHFNFCLTDICIYLTPDCLWNPLSLMILFPIIPTWDAHRTISYNLKIRNNDWATLNKISCLFRELNMVWRHWGVPACLWLWKGSGGAIR